MGGFAKDNAAIRDGLVSRPALLESPIPGFLRSVCICGVYEQKGMPGWFAVPENELPVKLPNVKISAARQW